MKNLPYIAIAAAVLLVIAGGVLHVIDAANASADPSTPVLQPGDPDLSAAFRETGDRAKASQDARQFAALCRSLADTIEFDGSQQSPRIRTGVQLDDLRRWARHLLLDGRTFSETYPTLAVAVGEFLDSKVGTSGGVLSAEHRARYVAAFRSLARSSEAAAQF